MRAQLIVALACFTAISLSAEQRARDELVVKGRVGQVHSARLFTLQGNIAGESEVLVIPPRPVSMSLVGYDVEVRGLLRRFSGSEVGAAWKDLDAETRRSFSGRRVLVATSLMASAPAQPPSAPSEAPQAGEVPAGEAGPSYALPIARPVVHLRPTTLVDFINDFAGQHVSVSHARVVGVYEPGALLIEPATRYQMTMDYRDRILVMIDAAQLTVPPESIVSAVVSVEGIARTLADLRLKAGNRWPAKLTKEAAARLEVRAAILASSVRMPDGTELTSRIAASAR